MGIKRELVDYSGLPSNAERLDNETPQERNELAEFEEGIKMIRNGDPEAVEKYISKVPRKMRVVYNELFASVN